MKASLPRPQPGPRRIAVGPATRGGILISICIPTLNRANYLPETLESITAQLVPDVELLVYDTGSADGSVALLDSFAHRTPGMRFFHIPERRGIDETLLLLHAEASGEYVWFFGSDDVLEPGAIEAVRRRILAAPIPPSLVFLNHRIVDDAGRPLIAASISRTEDVTFPDGRKSAAWLGLHLGFISACIFRRRAAPPRSETNEFLGSLWMGAYLNLRSLAAKGPALCVGTPAVRARRNPGNIYDYGEVFCRQANRVFWAARRLGFGWLTLYRALNRTVRLFHLHFAVSQRCDDPGGFRGVFPVMFRACWSFPWFWLLLVPVRFCPPGILRALRDMLRGRRVRRSGQDASRWRQASEPAGQEAKL